MNPLLIFIVVQFFASLFLHSFFLHRYGTHRQFSMSHRMERFFFILTYLCQGSSFLDPKAYAIIHLEHHAHSDTPKDPHSPLNFSILKWGLDFPIAVFRMMKYLRYVFAEVYYGRSELLKLYSDKKFPGWPHFEKFASSRFSSLLFIIIYAFIYFSLASSWWFWVFFPITVLSGPAQGAIVNWCGHIWGYRRYKLSDNSRNTPVLNVVMLGELNQNNHHKDPDNPNFAKAWYEFDLIYPVILFFNWIRIIKLKKA
jgi:stearoyl-CoA desaturase (delta-9 desaturase)